MPELCETFLINSMAPFIMNSKLVEEKIPKENFRVLSEMRILVKIRLVILDFGRVCTFFL